MPRTLIRRDQIDKTKFEELRVKHGYFVLLFSDNSAFVIGAPGMEEQYALDDVELIEIEFHEQVALGLMTKEEHAKECRDLRKEREEREEQIERQEYERLRVKFEGKPV